MDSLDEILKTLYEAKISVEDIIQERFKNPIKLVDPIIISVKK